MTVETINENGTATLLPRTKISTEVKEGDTLATICLGSDWVQDDADLEKAIPLAIPDGLVYKPYRKLVMETRGGVQYERTKTFLEPIMPKPTATPAKAGAVNLEALDDKKLRIFASEKGIVLPAETKEKMTPRFTVLEIIRKGLAK